MTTESSTESTTDQQKPTPLTSVEFLKKAADRLRSVAREMVDEARLCTDLDALEDGETRRAIRTMYDVEKVLRDLRAAKIGKLKPAPQAPGKKTNVGDPMPHGQENRAGAVAKAK